MPIQAPSTLSTRWHSFIMRAVFIKDLSPHKRASMVDLSIIRSKKSVQKRISLTSMTSHLSSGLRNELRFYICSITMEEMSMLKMFLKPLSQSSSGRIELPQPRFKILTDAFHASTSSLCSPPSGMTFSNTPSIRGSIASQSSSQSKVAPSYSRQR
ncbi:hypothetical protein FGO68_gene2224 [Halteria grandinella]|uniref:Uncharacterized protein n=1 Tax=Halteria grandinella TaxID=5974 RepID=A0A8J8T7I3_HALGN|nr:hypothetical protein FGO68_gene2224 [Halteria grandinella]